MARWPAGNTPAPAITSSARTSTLRPGCRARPTTWPASTPPSRSTPRGVSPGSSPTRRTTAGSSTNTPRPSPPRRWPKPSCGTCATAAAVPEPCWPSSSSTTTGSAGWRSNTASPAAPPPGASASGPTPAQGWLSQQTTWTPNPATAGRANYSGFDPFGRPKYVDPPEGTQHRVEFFYGGERRIARQYKVGYARNSNGSIAEHKAGISETFDVIGRLRGIEEGSIDNNAADLIAEYTYNVDGRLAKARLSPRGGGSSQTRTFTWDQRGFLLAEEEPESGKWLYSEFDATGNYGRKNHLSGLRDLGYEYDAADRLVKVKDTPERQPRSSRSGPSPPPTRPTTGSWAGSRPPGASTTRGFPASPAVHCHGRGQGDLDLRRPRRPAQRPAHRGAGLRPLFRPELDLRSAGQRGHPRLSALRLRQLHRRPRPPPAPSPTSTARACWSASPTGPP